jgi:hypothetical protein
VFFFVELIALINTIEKNFFTVRQGEVVRCRRVVSVSGKVVGYKITLYGYPLRGDKRDCTHYVKPWVGREIDEQYDSAVEADNKFFTEIKV